MDKSTAISGETISRVISSLLNGYHVEVESTSIINGVVTGSPTIIDGKSRVYQVRDKIFKLVGHSTENVDRYRNLVLRELGTSETDFVEDGYFSVKGNLTENGYQAVSRLLKNYIKKTEVSKKYLKIDTWFVLTYLLGYQSVRNYDGSWTEWGNAVRAPIRLGGQP